jgi:hypothetical protein
MYRHVWMKGVTVAVKRRCGEDFLKDKDLRRGWCPVEVTGKVNPERT